VNIPASVTTLGPGMTAPPAGAAYGPNIRGASQPYMGPRTPPGPKHRYHIQMFALGTTLALASSATYGDLIDAMKGQCWRVVKSSGLGRRRHMRRGRLRTNDVAVLRASRRTAIAIVMSRPHGSSSSRVIGLSELAELLRDEHCAFC